MESNPPQLLNKFELEKLREFPINTHSAGEYTGRMEIMMNIVRSVNFRPNTKAVPHLKKMI